MLNTAQLMTMIDRFSIHKASSLFESLSRLWVSNQVPVYISAEIQRAAGVLMEFLFELSELPVGSQPHRMGAYSELTQLPFCITTRRHGPEDCNHHINLLLGNKTERENTHDATNFSG
jgi:hypothetical protein